MIIIKIIHHIDADGLGAAAIINRELINIFNQPKIEDFIKYNHSGYLYLEYEYLEEGETIYIVDLSLDDTILEVIKNCINKRCKVVYIDHHASTNEFIDNMPDKSLFDNPNFVFMCRIGISACLLTWVYACMTDEERENPNEITFDFTDKRDHLAFYPGTSDMREYYVPLVIRYIDDNDVWRQVLPEAKFFTCAFLMEEDKSPTSTLWDEVLYSERTKLRNMVSDGEVIFRYETDKNASLMNKSFEHEICGHTCLCINAIQGNSRIFGDEFNEYPIVCKFGYDGYNNQWVYSFYTNEDSSVDASNVVQTLGAQYHADSFGGHVHAAGMRLKKNIFNER
jgi:hypothetical protein